MLPVCRFLFAALIGASAPAQTCIYTWGIDPMGTLPPRANGRGLLAAPGVSGYYRFHLRIPATLFANVPMRITEFSLPVREGWRRLSFESLVVRMGQTTRTTLSTTFALNITSPLQDVLVADDHVFFEGIGPSWVPIGMQQPFTFLPGHGDLLIEIVQRGGTVLDSVAYTGLAEGYIGELLGSAFEQQLPTIGGTGMIPRFRFCADSAELSLSGEACGGTSAPLLGLAGTPSLGGQTTFWLSNAPANSLAFLAFGFDNRPPYPLDLGSLGAPGCHQYFPVVFAAPVLTNGQGLGQHLLSIPNQPGLVGQIVLGQYAALVPSANTLGVLTSNYGRALIGQ